MKSLTFTIPLLFIILLSCGEESKKENSDVDKNGKLKVISVNYPLHYFAQVIGGDFVDAVYPIPTDVDPAYWNPDEKALIRFQSADLILLNGAGYAKWISKVSLSSSKLVNTSKSFSENYLDLKESTLHSHGPGGAHEHEGYAFTTWLNFENGVKQAELVKDALVKKIPNAKDQLNSNFNLLKDELISLHQKMTEVAKNLDGETLFTSHPVYQYLADAYKLKMISVHWEPGEMPDEVEWEMLDNKLKKNPSKIMLWEDEPLPQIAERLEKQGVKIVVFNPCGNKPEKGNFMSLMNNNIVSLSQIMN